LAQGRTEAAQESYRRALDAFRSEHDRWGRARSLTDLGYIYCQRREFEAAHAAYREGLVLFNELGHRRGIARALEGAAFLAARNNQPSRALTLAAAAGHLRTQIGAPLPPAERAKLDGELLQAWQDVSQDEGQRAWKRGHEMHFQAAILFALEDGD